MTASPISKLLHRLSLGLIVVAMACAGILSAARMAEFPRPELVAYVSAGGSLDDLCGTVPESHDHHCPFCRLLPDPPDTRPALRVSALGLLDLTRPLIDLRGGPESAHGDVLARGPPASA